MSKTATSSSEEDVVAKKISSSPAESNADDVIKSGSGEGNGGGGSSVKGGSCASGKVADEEKFRSEMAIFWTMPPPKEFMNRHNQVRNIRDGPKHIR